MKVYQPVRLNEPNIEFLAIQISVLKAWDNLEIYQITLGCVQ
jgi:hypothetical protein